MSADVRVELRDGVHDDSTMPAWPDGWPLPRVGEDVDDGERWWLVEAVVWQVDDDPLVVVHLSPVTGGLER